MFYSYRLLSDSRISFHYVSGSYLKIPNDWFRVGLLPDVSSALTANVGR